ncbi:helix-turn-helix domain-containing protein [Leptolyngbya cf. ectocarpi LEGE 11479]|uniref:Helix-turn-helix domain-containing protein n=1 Tax=Leptolyngbya cf. ectocarpi LEGE 11479 TaxID=1828722 RepID=A0A929FC56_LEPEC|nr:RodZ domain-containing protein [Leptolyngbya ectocarpi]MBE9069654.1 helix-turn-helix domain-containing protein [Leptolyngbya cf. ectocarpi LEGE 11479]
MKRQGPTSTQQQEHLLALGAVLRDAREASGQTLDEVAGQVLVRPRLLIALEEARTHELPEPIYVRGLIRRYGDVLGLDGNALSQQYVSIPAPKSPGRSWSREAVQLRPYHLYAAYVALIAVSVSGLSYLMQRALPQDSAEPILDPVAVEQLTLQRTSPTPSDSATNLAEPDAPAPEEPIVVAVEFVQQSWVRVTADGDEAYEGILQEGTERSWTAQESLTIRAGNAGGVVLAYNQGTAKPMGQPGTVVEQTFTPGEGDVVSLAR